MFSQKPREAAPLASGERVALPAVGSIGLSTGLSLSQGQDMSRFLGALGSGAQKRGGAQLSHSLVVMVVVVVVE